MSKKILIIHDRFQYKGGGERLVLIMAQGLSDDYQVDIATEYWDEENSFAKGKAPGKIIILGKQIKTRGLGYISAQFRFFLKTKFIKNYDTIIFSGNNCLSAIWRCKKSQRKIMYCHHPVRYAYDLKDYYYKKYPIYAKPIFLFFVYLARLIYKWGIKKMDAVMCNSKNVQNRLRKYVGVKSTVVYPPIDLEKFKFKISSPQEKSGYYLSFARLVDLKRVDDIIRAFQQLPKKKLIVASGGPELEKINRMAEGYENIKALGFVADDKLAELISGCIANIYIPLDEDFGMTPLEAAAIGKPTIGVDDGGLKETIIHQKTGYLIPCDYQISDIITAVEWLDKKKAQDMSKNCINQASFFSRQKFVLFVKNML